MPTIEGEGRSGGVRIASRSSTPIIDETWTFLVRADSPTQTRLEILNTPGLPLPRVTSSSSGLTLCKSTSAERNSESTIYWDITAEFSSEVEEGQDGNPENPGDPPTAWVPIYETKFERLQEVVTKDKNGDAAANSAGQAFETGLTISRFIPVWEFYQFEPASVTDETIIDRNETVNSAIFKGRAIDTLLLTVMSSVQGLFYGQRLRLTQYSLKYNSEKWTHKRLDTGTQYLDGGSLKTFRDSDGSVFLGSLDGSGAKQTAGTAPAVLEFDIYDQISFSFLRV